MTLLLRLLRALPREISELAAEWADHTVALAHERAAPNMNWCPRCRSEWPCRAWMDAAESRAERLKARRKVNTPEA